MSKVKIEAFELYPAGVYPVTVIEVTEDNESKYGAQFRFKFSLGGSLEGRTLTGWCRQSGSVKSKFFEWYSALMGTAIKPGDEVDTGDLVGKTAQAVIKIKNGDDGTQKNIIDSILPNQATRSNGNGQKPAEHDDPITAFWQYANANKISKQFAAEYIAETGGDFARALELMKAQAA